MKNNNYIKLLDALVMLYNMISFINNQQYNNVSWFIAHSVHHLFLTFL